jgi:hypothetical protein
LIDREVQEPFVDQLERAGQQVVPAADHLPAQAVLLDDLSDALCVTGVDGEHPGQLLVAEVVGVDRRELLAQVGVGRDDLGVDRLARLLDRGHCAVDAGLNVQRARRRDEQCHVTLRDLGCDLLAHGEARLVESLADVRHPRLRAGPRSIGVVGQHRDPLRACALDRRLECALVDDAHRDPVRLGADRRVERVDHLADVRLRRAAPRVLHVDERCGVGGTVLRRHEERVRRHVVDERELPTGVRGVLPVRGGERPLRAKESR